MTDAKAEGEASEEEPEVRRKGMDRRKFLKMAGIGAGAEAASAQHSRARGWGLMTMTLRVISASSDLKNTVATGLVDGVSAKTTPAGRGTSTIFAAGSNRGVT